MWGNCIDETGGQESLMVIEKRGMVIMFMSDLTSVTVPLNDIRYTHERLKSTWESGCTVVKDKSMN